MRRRRRRGFGQGSIRKRGLSWSIAWRENGRRRFASAPDEGTAKRMLAKILSDAALGTVGLKPDLKGAPTLGELAGPWLKRREKTHRAWRDDACRWRVHLEPFFGRCRPGEVDAGMIRRFVELKLVEGNRGRGNPPKAPKAAKPQKGLAPASVGMCIRLLSTFFADVVEQGHVTVNPVATLPRATRKLYRSDHDPRDTPFLERLEDVRRIYLALPEPTATMFAVGSMAGLRTSEVIGLSWDDVDLANRRIHVRQQAHRGRLGPLKDNESRTVPLQAALAPILAEHKLRTGGTGLLFQPACPERGGRPELGSPAMFVRPNTLHRHLRGALKACGLPPLSWYHATRHTFASQWVMGGHNIAKLQAILGHSSIVTTQRYAHLGRNLFDASELNAMAVDLSRPAGTVLPIAESRPNLTPPTASETSEALAFQG
ncbi:MAG: site-specific integrase [Deltaproteobacteria bacterium]|nr:site-specific integrase [Deltaproteobacteria bacterium]